MAHAWLLKCSQSPYICSIRSYTPISSLCELRFKFYSLVIRVLFMELAIAKCKHFSYCACSARSLRTWFCPQDPRAMFCASPNVGGSIITSDGLWMESARIRPVERSFSLLPWPLTNNWRNTIALLPHLRLVYLAAYFKDFSQIQFFEISHIFLIQC